MIDDPYRVLGVSESCSDAELKKAYRELSKRWHPDANLDNPEAAEQKFKQVQEAYRQIVDARARGTSAYGTNQSYGQGGYSSYGPTGSYGSAGNGGREYQDFYGGFEDFFNQWAGYSNQRRQEEESNEMTAARNYINAGHYQEALTALSGVPEGNRSARWNYLAAMASQGLGKNVDALQYAKRAADLDPNNPTYMNLLQQLQHGGTWYQNRGETYGGFGSMSSAGSWCMSMLALNLFCNCCLGGGVCCI